MLEQENTTLSQEQTEIPADLLPEAEGEKPEADALPAEPEKAAEPEERPEEMGDNTVILTADAPEVEGQAPLPTPPEGEANEGPTGGGDVPASFSYPY